jgi:hypothetical protein
MKLFRAVFFTTLFAFSSLSFGQTSPGDVVVDVPFAFTVAGEKLPAGHYIVAAQNDLIKVFNRDTRAFYVPSHATIRNKADGSKLVFHRYGDSYFLSEVWVTGNTIGKELFPSRAERELASEKAEMELAVVRPQQK